MILPARRWCACCALLGALIVALPALGAGWKGRAYRVDKRRPDVLYVAPVGSRYERIVYLFGVAVPREGQPAHRRARAAVIKAIKGKDAIFTPVPRGRGGALMRKVLGANAEWARVAVGKVSLQKKLLQAGWAWHDRRYSADLSYARLEHAAWRARRGLWTRRNPAPPWRVIHSVVTAGDPWDTTGPSRASTRSKLFHARGCRADRCRGCSKTFRSYSTAELFGYRPHRCVGKPHARPPARDRACRRDSDCVLLPRRRCGCPPCGILWRTAVNRAARARFVARQAKLRCRPHRCRPCSGHSHWLGSKAVCRRGSCATR